MLETLGLMSGGWPFFHTERWSGVARFGADVPITYWTTISLKLMETGDVPYLNCRHIGSRMVDGGVGVPAGSKDPAGHQS